MAFHEKKVCQKMIEINVQVQLRYINMYLNFECINIFWNIPFPWSVIIRSEAKRGFYLEKGVLSDILGGAVIGEGRL